MSQGIIGACQQSVADVLRGFDERERVILQARVFSLAKRRTLHELAQEFSLTRERIRQIEKTALVRITKRTRSSMGELLRRASGYLKTVVGTACPISSIAPDRVDSSASGEIRNLTLGMLIWLAGPYEFHRGWLVRRPAKSLIALTKAIFARLAARDEPIEIIEVTEALSEIDIQEQWAIEWLVAIDRVKILSDKVCPWDGGLREKAYLVLRVKGTAMSAEQICAAIADGCQGRSLVNCLQSNPDRFQKTGRDLFSIAEEGGRTYTSIKDFILTEIAKSGGRANKESLIDATLKTFGVSKRTVVTALSNPIFLLTNAGFVRVRIQDDPLPKINPIEFTRRCYRLQCEFNGQRKLAWSYRLKVDSELIRGSGTAVPAAFGVLLGLRPGNRQTVASAFGEINFSWNGPQAGIGSLRQVVQGLGATEGDFVYVSIADSSTVIFSIVRTGDIDEVTGWERVCLHVSGRICENKEQCIATVGTAIGLSSDEGFDVADIRRRFEMRREHDLLESIPAADLPAISEDLSSLLEYAMCR